MRVLLELVFSLFRGYSTNREDSDDSQPLPSINDSKGRTNVWY